MQTSHHEPVTLSDRIMAAGLCALCVGVTLGVLLFVFFYLSRGLGAELLLHVHAMRAWLVCMACGAALGLAIGSEPLPDLLAHFWGTAKPRQLALTIGMWSTLVVITALTELASR